MQVIQAEGGSVRNVVALVRRGLNLRLDSARVIHDEDQDYGLHRIELEGNVVIEALIAPRRPCRIVGGV